MLCIISALKLYSKISFCNAKIDISKAFNVPSHLFPDILHSLRFKVGVVSRQNDHD